MFFDLKMTHKVRSRKS